VRYPSERKGMEEFGISRDNPTGRVTIAPCGLYALCFSPLPKQADVLKK